jgi:hypothetical protein
MPIRSQHSFATKFKISEWLRNNQEAIRTGKPTFPTLARQVSEALEIPTSASQVAHICKTIGLTWEHPAGSGAKPIATLRREIDEIRQQVREMDTLLVSLCQKLGEPYPLRT